MIVLAQRGWQALSGLLTLYLVTRFLNPDEQGYYYTITTLVGVLLAVDLGLTNILVPFAAKHVPSGAENGAAFYGIGRYAAKWFFITGLCVIPIVPLGSLFLGLHDAEPHGVTFVWSLVAIATVANYIISPFVLLLEGSGKVREVYGNRLAIGIFSSLVMWSVFIFGGGLLAAAMPPLVGFVYTGLWLFTAHYELLKKIVCKQKAEAGWGAIVWPLQWRTGANVFAGYLLVFAYTPMVFLLFGPKEAGQMGLTMATVNTIFVLSISGLVSKFPQLARHVSDGKRELVAEIFKQEMKKSAWLYAALSMGLVSCLILLSNHPIAGRFLDLSQTVCVLLAMFFYMKASAFGYLMRAYLVDYALKLNLVSLGAVLLLGALTSFVLGLWGVPLSMIIVFSMVLAPSMSSLVRRLA